MKEFLNQLTPALTTALIGVLIAFIGYIGKEVAKLVPVAIDFVVAKIGLTNYQRSKIVAQDIFYQVEEYFRKHPEAKEQFISKAAYFIQLIKIKIPGITDEEIETLKEAIAGEFNKDKPAVQKAIEASVETVTVAPIIKYATPEGVELQPVNTNTATQVAQ